MSIIEETWHKASYSKAETNCVETAYTTTGGAAVRDTQNRDKATLIFEESEWSAFLADVKADRL